MDDEGGLDSIRECQRGIDYWQARLVRALAEFAQLRRRDQFAADEVAAWMKWTSNWAASQLALAEDLVTRLPRTVDALEQGQIDFYKARALNDLTKPLSEEPSATSRSGCWPRRRSRPGSRCGRAHGGS